MKRALVTGAGARLGRDMAIYLAERGYDVLFIMRAAKQVPKRQHRPFGQWVDPRSRSKLIC